MSLSTKPGRVRTSWSCVYSLQTLKKATFSFGFSSKRPTSSFQPTISENMTFSSKRRNTSIDLCCCQLGNTLFRPTSPILGQQTAIFFQIRPFLGFFVKIKNQFSPSLQIYVPRDFASILSAIVQDHELNNSKDQGVQISSCSGILLSWKLVFEGNQKAPK